MRYQDIIRIRRGEGEEKSIKKEKELGRRPRHDGRGRSEVTIEMKVKLIGGEVIVNTGNIKA